MRRLVQAGRIGEKIKNMATNKKPRDYHAEYLRRKTRGRHPQEELKYGKTFPKRSGEGAVKQVWFHRKIKINQIKPSYRKKFQLRLMADYTNEKTGEIRTKIVSFSKLTGHKEKIDKDRMLDQAINHALGILGGSHWFLIKIRKREYIQWNYGKKGRMPVA
jgi:hypothetical protein